MSSVCLRGVYAITPDDPDPERLLARVTPVLHQGIDVLQLRAKQLTPRARRAVAHALQSRCAAARIPLIINDDLDLAREVGAAGVHLGRHDPDPFHARALLGPEAIIGISSYASLERAAAYAAVVDYIALGSLFPSSTKPEAPHASLDLLTQARSLARCIVGIGGITAHNALLAIQAGADAVAVISTLFSASDPIAATQLLHHVVHAALNHRATQNPPPAQDDPRT